MARLEQWKEQSRTFIVRTARVGKLGSLLASGHALRMGIEKLLLIPILVRFILDKETVGQFLWLLGWINSIGFFMTAGVGSSMMRLHAEAKKDGTWPALVGTGVTLTAVATCIFLLLAGTTYLMLETQGDITSNSILVVTLSVYFLLLANRTVLDTAFRVELQYHKTAMVESLAAVVLLAAIPMTYLFGKVGLGLGYVLSSAAAMALQIPLAYKLLGGRGLFQTQWARRLIVVAPPFIFASAMATAFYQSGRIVIGFFRTYGDVTIFFVAESIAMLALAPIQFLANVIFSMVARKNSAKDISTTAPMQFVISCLIGCAVVFAGLQVGGKWILAVLYAPEIVDASWPLLRILAIGAAAQVLFLLSRCFVFRFCSLKRIMLYSALNFFVLIAILLAVVPTYGSVGAAWAVTAGGVFAGLLWFGTYLYMFVLRRNTTPAT